MIYCVISTVLAALSIVSFFSQVVAIPTLDCHGFLYDGPIIIM